MNHSITKLRNEIDSIDAQLLELLKKRLSIVDEVKNMKNPDYYSGRPIREHAVFQRWLKIAPELPTELLDALSRLLISAALKAEISEFTIHVATEITEIATHNYKLAAMQIHEAATTMLTSHNANPCNNLILLPLNNMRYWQSNIYEKLAQTNNNFHIIELLPLTEATKEVAVIGCLPEEFLPTNRLFLTTNLHDKATPTSAMFEPNLTVENGFKIYHLTDDRSKHLAGLELKLIGGYSDTLIFQK